MVDKAPYVYCSLSLPKDIILATLCYKHIFPFRRNKFRVQKKKKKKKKKKKHTLKNSRCIFVFYLVWLLELTFIIKVVTNTKYQSAIQLSSTKHSNLHCMCMRILFSCRAYSTSLIMALLHLCQCSKLADGFLGTLLLILTEI